MQAAEAETVVIPAGAPFREAAGWVGHAAWAELRLHELLTGWLADEEDAAASIRWWAVRADAASRAEAWHRRLPELREAPRPTFLVPSGPEVVDRFSEVSALVGDAREPGLLRVLVALRAGYERHGLVAVGPADGPVAATLVEAEASVSAAIDSSPAAPAPATATTLTLP